MVLQHIDGPNESATRRSRLSFNLAHQVETLREPYPECTEAVDGYKAGPGAIYIFTEGERAYRFDISDGSNYASSMPSTVDGREVTVMVQPPFAATSPAIQIPRKCPIFQIALAKLEALGVRRILFFNQPTGGFKEFGIRELQDT